MQPDIRTTTVTRYIAPLREGGSLPAIAEAEDGFMYVVKFRGAGQGTKALIADLIGGELARAAGLKTPEIVLIELDAAFGRTEPDEEIQDLLKASTGLNLGVHFLSGALGFDPAVNKVPALLASKIVWLDALLMNVDRTARNTNMLYWRNELWLIDHGAALYFHHNWTGWEEQALKPFVQIKDHVLLPAATALEEADAFMKAALTPDTMAAITALIPGSWLEPYAEQGDAAAQREVYRQFLTTRLANATIFLNQALHARTALI